jgi:hypothetical protein
MISTFGDAAGRLDLSMRFIAGVALALAVAISSLRPVPALAQDFRPNRVAVDYIEPRSESLQGVYERLKRSGVLEELAEFLAPLRLPTTLRLWGTQCYAYADWMAYYDPQEHVIRLCYEWIDRLEKMRPEAVTEEGFEPARVFTGAVVGLLLHETGHAMVDLLKVPVFGREEDAADQIAEFMALQFDKTLAETVTEGAAWYWLTDARTILYLDEYADVHSTSMERFLNHLCLGYGADPASFKDLADRFMTARAPRCVDEYRQVENAFNQTILPYVDPQLLQEVRARHWFATTKFE